VDRREKIVGENSYPNIEYSNMTKYNDRQNMSYLCYPGVYFYKKFIKI